MWPEVDDSEPNSQEEGYYYYCEECYVSVANKKKRSKDVKFQQAKRRRTHV